MILENTVMPFVVIPAQAGMTDWIGFPPARE
jgi:hypothetical protein